MFTESPLSLYLHIPFCSTRCTYCAFNTYIDLDELIPDYVEALCKEISFLGQNNPHPSIKTIFLGGGTPSLIRPRQYEAIFRSIHDNFRLDDDVEISLESNPNDLSVAYLEELRQIEFNRISIGMQSATDKVLTLFAREHDQQQVKEAVGFARLAGFDNVNLDVIFASPYETLEDWKLTINELTSLSPEHISMYGLELKGGTDLRLRVDSGELPQPDDDLFADMYEMASEAFAKHGYGQYEISNWCQPNRQCQHNLQYWRNLPYAGLGAGAHGFAGGYRYSTITAPKRYIESLLVDNYQEKHHIFPMTPAVAKADTVDTKMDLYDTIMMGLRMTREGITRKSFLERFGVDFVDTYPNQIAKFESMGFLAIQDDRVHLTQAGRLLSNAVIREFV